jgi:hypothetical protein
MAATSWNPKQPKIVTRDGGIPEVLTFKEEASQTFKAGTPVKLDGGEVEIAQDGTVGFLGIAMEDASGTTNAAIRVQVVRPGDRIVAKVTNNGTDALPTTLTQGMAYGFYIDADSVFYADANDATTHILYYNAPVYDATGASTYWGYFSLVPAQAGSIDGDDNA